MKKLALILSILLALMSLTACGSPQPVVPSEENPSEQSGNSLYQSDFVQTISIATENQNQITPELRLQYNLMARDFYFCYLPDFNDYAQAVDTDAGAFVFYALWPVSEEPIPQAEIENKLSELFVGFEQAPPFVHQDFGRYAWYENQAYSLPPEGCPDFNRLFYQLDELEIQAAPDGSGQTYLICTATDYYFNDTETYEPGTDELWLQEQANELGLSELDAANKLLAEGKLSELESQAIQTVFVLDLEEQTAKILSNNYL